MTISHGLISHIVSATVPNEWGWDLLTRMNSLGFPQEKVWSQRHQGISSKGKPGGLLCAKHCATKAH